MKKPTPSSKLLRKAQRFIRKPENWIQGKWAMDQDGIEVSSASPSACKFCLDGAVIRAVGPRGPTQYATAPYKYLVNAIEKHDHRFHGPIEFNDYRNTSHEQVMHVLDDAICIAEKAGD